MDASGASKGIMFVVLAVVVGGGWFAYNRYMQAHPGATPVKRHATGVRPSAGFGSRPQDFADPRKSTLRYVSKYERSQGVQPNTTIGGRR